MSKKIAIIGAGVTGISAAMHLAQRGAEVHIFEATQHIGGRARSFRERTTGETIDNGQHVLMGCYHEFLKVLALLKTDHLLARQPALKVLFLDANGRRDMLDTSRLPGKAGIAAGILLLKNVSLASRLKAFSFAAKLQLGLLKSEEVSCYDFLKKHGQTDEMITRFWEPIIIATLNADPRQAASVLLTEVLKRAFFGGREASQLIIPKVGLSELLAPFKSWLQANGGKVHMSEPIHQILFKNECAVGLKLSNGEEFACDAVISAIPPRALLRILPPEIAAHESFKTISATLGEYEFSPIVSLYLWLDREIMGEDFAAMLGTTTQWVFNRRAFTDAAPDLLKKYPGHVSLTVSAGNSLVDTAPEQVALQCFGELQAAFPAARDAKLLEWKVIKEKAATFLATPHFEPKRIKAETPLSNFVLAGDWTATQLPATLEGAAQSGVKAAELVIGYA
ncbi:MAG TPA: hydroxysqualene dehydroxylase HpnE [Patescibacteria group bacterium]|nr:hydroxysqualene dehydroxylase HpnE [Patescibacteria group bacterium]